MNDKTLILLSESDFELWDKVPVCGCGRPEELYEAYRQVLAAHPQRDGEEFPSYDERLARCDLDPLTYDVISGVLSETLGATEHGGAVRGAWRTDAGDKLLAILNGHAEYGYEAMVAMAAD